jgi:hypothetical protein
MGNEGVSWPIAVISLKPADAGGPSKPISSPTQSLLLIFGGGTRPVAPWTIGARIWSLDGSPFEPGGPEQSVRLEFLTVEEGLALAVPNATFALWGGRVVGSGRVTGSPGL